jgi:hypothetical protein
MMYEIIDECGDISFVDLLGISVDRPAEVGIVFGTSYASVADLDSDGVDCK